MIDSIQAWLDAVLRWTAAIPETGWAVLAGLFIGGMLTQWIKRSVPVGELLPGLSKGMQVFYVRILALVFSFLPTFFLWPDENAVWVALAVGVTTPTVYRVCTLALYRRWPHLERTMSGTD